MNKIGVVHAVWGLLFVLVFLLSGRYMLMNFPGLYEGNEGIRMMYRSTHIYLLMSALINIAIGLNYSLEKNTVIKIIQSLASLIILISPILLLLGFMNEPQHYDLERSYSFMGVLFLLVGVLAHCVLKVVSWFLKK